MLVLVIFFSEIGDKDNTHLISSQFDEYMLLNIYFKILSNWTSLDFLSLNISSAFSLAFKLGIFVSDRRVWFSPPPVRPLSLISSLFCYFPQTAVMHLFIRWWSAYGLPGNGGFFTVFRWRLILGPCRFLLGSGRRLSIPMDMFVLKCFVMVVGGRIQMRSRWSRSEDL